MTKTVSPIKWAGGKSRVLPYLLPHFPAQCERYIEPFLGGANVFLGSLEKTQRKQSLLSDVNLRLIRAYQGLRDSFGDVKAILEGFENTKEAYLGIKIEFNNHYSISDAGIAARFLYLNRACFNGLWRENRLGEFNVPYGNYQKLVFPWESLERFSKALHGVSLERRGFEHSLLSANEGDLVYLDPPYDPLTVTASFTSYSAGGFSAKDQETLAELAKQAMARGAKVVASNHDTPRIRQLWGKGFEFYPLEVRRSIAAKGENRKTASEVIMVSKN